MKTPKFSIVISTIGDDTIHDTLRSIQKSTFTDFEIILISQIKKLSLKDYERKKLKHFQSKEIGVSKGRNLGISKARGEIICFTDDDCSISKDWLFSLNTLFDQHKDIIGIFGKTLPMQRQKNQHKLINPCVFLKNTSEIISEPCYHDKHFGYGNNMAFRRTVFDTYGTFKEWLGINAIGEAAEDAEFALRLLLNKEKLLYHPSVEVTHNRLLTKMEYHNQLLHYECGELSCYGYFAFQNQSFAKKILLSHLRERLRKIGKIIKLFLTFKSDFFLEALYFIPVQIKIIKGLIIGYYFSKNDPLIS